MVDPKKEFTAGEVVALVESLKSDFRAVVEVLAPLPERLEKVELRLEKVETRLQAVEDAVKIAVPSHERRLAKLEAKVGV